VVGAGNLFTVYGANRNADGLRTRWDSYPDLLGWQDRLSRLGTSAAIDQTRSVISVQLVEQKLVFFEREGNCGLLGRISDLVGRHGSKNGQNEKNVSRIFHKNTSRGS